MNLLMRMNYSGKIIIRILRCIFNVKTQSTKNNSAVGNRPRVFVKMETDFLRNTFFGDSTYYSCGINDR